jgi:hypothetical protein
MKSLAVSLTRRASRHTLSKSISANSQLDNTEQTRVEAEQVEEVDQSPPSPASTVGIPRRHSTLSLLERPSTIRLVSPPPPNPGLIPMLADPERDDLPFFGSARNMNSLKKRRSMAPSRINRDALANPLTRKSMPALPNGTSAHIASIYPALPAVSYPPVPAIPGAYLFDHTSSSAASPSRFVFGLHNGEGISKAQFAEAGQQVMKEMEAKMRATHGQGAMMFGEELLKGKKAEMGKLVHVNQEVGIGYGLGGMGVKKDRYAEAHQREFAK